MLNHEECNHEGPNIPVESKPPTLHGITAIEIRALFALRNFSTVHILQFFEDADQPQELLAISIPIRNVAFALAEGIADGPELTVALRKMLGARDAFIRYYLAVHGFQTGKKEHNDNQVRE